MDNQWVKVIELCGEGGSISLLGMEMQSGEWVFKRDINEIFSLEELDDEAIIEKRASKEARSLKPTIKKTYEAVGWANAKKILEDYPLNHLGPRNIHPDFHQQLWQLALEQGFDHYRLRRWARGCFPTISGEIFDLYFLIKESRHTVILTGAGMSTEAGIPDFRSKDGWWKNIDPLTVATIDALETNYDLFHEFYSFRVRALEDCQPHEGHYVLGKWQKNGLIHHVATQNVDSLHEAGNSTDVDHLHGSILTFRCHDCGNSATKQQFLNKESCSSCSGKLRPYVVLFGEALPEEAWNNALYHIQKADLVIVIGTSLQVYPVSQLPSMTKGKTVYINKEVSEQRSYFHLVIEGGAKETLVQVDQLFMDIK